MVGTRGDAADAALLLDVQRGRKAAGCSVVAHTSRREAPSSGSLTSDTSKKRKEFHYPCQRMARWAVIGNCTYGGQSHAAPSMIRLFMACWPSRIDEATTGYIGTKCLTCCMYRDAVRLCGSFLRCPYLMQCNLGSSTREVDAGEVPWFATGDGRPCVVSCGETMRGPPLPQLHLLHPVSSCPTCTLPGHWQNLHNICEDHLS